MNLADAITQTQNEEFANRELQRSKCGDYTGDDCPNCGRQRVMLGDDGKKRCEKCYWCIDDGQYDGALMDYMR